MKTYSTNFESLGPAVFCINWLSDVHTVELIKSSYMSLNVTSLRLLTDKRMNIFVHINLNLDLKYRVD